MPKERLRHSMAERLLATTDGRNTNKWFPKHLKDEQMNWNETIDNIVEWTLGSVLMALRSRSMLTETAIKIGNKVRRNINIDEDNDNETKISLSFGLKIIEAYCNKDKPSSNFKLLGIEKMHQRGKDTSRTKNATYHLSMLDEPLFDALWSTLDVAALEESPRSTPSPDWENGYHVDGHTLIRRGNAEALKKVNSKDCPIVINALNKLQNTGYVINHEVFSVYKTLLKQQDRETVFSREFVIDKDSPFKHQKEERKPSREGMYLEADAILAIAEGFLNKPFYHRYNCDFRGRIYPGSSYLHEQSSDNAKGLILYDHKKPLGEEGAYWLGVHTANCWGEDKLTLDGRAKWVEDNMDDICAYATDPYTNKGWTKADKSWSFLACCFEWSNIQTRLEYGGNIEEYESALPLFIDGSNNGVQHLTALSLDDTVAHLVNLVPTEIPGDVYMFVAEKTWEALANQYKEISPELKANADRFIKEVTAIKLKMEKTVTKDDKNAVFAELDQWRKDNREETKGMFVPFWMRLANDKKLQRKTVKRPVMTLGYGVTKMGVREQVFDDTRTLSEELKFKEKGWVNPFGDLLMDTTLSNMKGPAAMLDLFRTLAERANNQGEFLKWTVPITGFPVVQAYEATKEIQVEVSFCGEGTSRAKYKGKGKARALYSPPKTLRLTIRPYERRKLEKRAQKTGAAPNLVHSFDAAHLTSTIIACDFPVTVIHDSFGCHIGDMSDMFRIVRETFVDFYASEPLEQVLTQLNALELLQPKGNLDLNAIMESDFAFC